MKGDRVVVYVDTGAQEAKTFEVVATRNGRTVEVKQARAMIEVSEVDKNGNEVHKSIFMASRVIALVEERTEEPEAPAQLFEAS